MISVSPAEIATIALIAFIVFGPRRLPEMARRAGRVLRDLKAIAGELRAGLEAEAGEAEDSLSEVRRALGPTLGTEPDEDPRSPNGTAGNP